MKKLLLLSLFVTNVYAQTAGLPPWGIIKNSTDTTKQTIMLGVNQAGNLDTVNNAGSTATNSLNVQKFSDGTSISQVNAGAVGISYYWSGAQKKDAQGNLLYVISPGRYTTTNTGTKLMYPAGWYDSTAQGKKWEAWGAGATDTVGVKASGFVSMEYNNGIPKNMTVKSFVVDTTSIKSTVWITNAVGDPMLEVTHLYGPTPGSTNSTLFQGLVTITNISGGPLSDVRYRRVMDWDVLDNALTPTIDAVGIKASVNSAPAVPRIIDYCDNGGEVISTTDASLITPYLACKPWVASTRNNDYTGATTSTTIAPYGTGSSFEFTFGTLECNESATFYIYYGAAGSTTEIASALSTVGASVYSFGYDPMYPTLAYGFGFKGVSGSAVAPTLPTKVASLPAGPNTDPTVVQTYAPPVLAPGYIYQSTFTFQKDKQWIGDLKRYDLDQAGNVSTNTPLTAKDKLINRLTPRNIWTVGYDPACMSSALPGGYNNFTTSNDVALGNLLYNCPIPGTLNTADNDALINFVRGQNSYWEENSAKTAIRSSILGDTYHSEMILVNAPGAPWSSDTNTFGKSEAYYRYQNGYPAFINSWANRRPQIYIGANDGMLHAFDSNLNEVWAFIPPPVLPMLRNMTGITGASQGKGTSNSIFTVDGPIVVKDVYYKAEGKWKTVLIGALGWGGNAYYALDITDPDNPKHLWSISNDVANKSASYWDSTGKKSTFAYATGCNDFDYSKLGGAWSRANIMLLPYTHGTSQQEWVAVFGGGFAGGASTTGSSNASTYGSFIFTLGLEPDGTRATSSCGATGNNIVASTGGHVLNVATVPDDSTSNIPNGVTADLTIVTGDGTSLASYYGGIVYFTDLQGKLWKMDMTKAALTDSNTNLFKMTQAFKTEATLANDRQAYNQLGTTIVSSLDINNNTQYKLFNYFGTGDKIRPQRRVTSINNRIYGVADSNFPGTGLTFTNQTVLNAVDVNAKSYQNQTNSWWANVYSETGVSPLADYEKVIGRAAVFNKYVYFSIYRPEDKPCPLYGTSRLLEITADCTPGGGGGLIGNGLPTAPVIDAKGNIYVGVSNIPPGSKVSNGRDNIAKFTTSNLTPTGKIQYKSWREKRVN